MTQTEFEQYVPDKRLRELYEKKVKAPKVKDITSLSTLWYMLFTILNVHDIYVIGGINPPSRWAASFEQYIYHRDFLELMLKQMAVGEQTEGALLVIKKLEEIGALNEANRFEL